ncbi:MAG: peptidoglycan-associated lipoprotein Pal [Deltaproteobacteria bacterium]|nr:peptidoglycan-associated lipoprotein Pal [Deltaproteobacteria bacterium]
MRSRLSIGLVVLIFALAGLGLLTGCAKKEVRTDMPAPGTEEVIVEAVDEEVSEADVRSQELREELARKRMAFLNKMVHFDFDKYNIRPDAAGVLKNKAAWLKENPDVSISIEGHCDERGTAQYNLALGERRATASKNFLVRLGVSASRMETISYGEERPLDPGNNEAAWAKNRRAQFVIK